jgi:hypothetical protein
MWCEYCTILGASVAWLDPDVVMQSSFQQALLVLQQHIVSRGRSYKQPGYDFRQMLSTAWGVLVAHPSSLEEVVAMTAKSRAVVGLLSPPFTAMPLLVSNAAQSRHQQFKLC